MNFRDNLFDLQGDLKGYEKNNLKTGYYGSLDIFHTPHQPVTTDPVSLQERYALHEVQASEQSLKTCCKVKRTYIILIYFSDYIFKPNILYTELLTGFLKFVLSDIPTTVFIEIWESCKEIILPFNFV